MSSTQKLNIKIRANKELLAALAHRQIDPAIATASLHDAGPSYKSARLRAKTGQGAIASNETASSNIAPSHDCTNALGYGTLLTSTNEEHSFSNRSLPCRTNPIGRLYLCPSFWQKPWNLATMPTLPH